MTFLHAVNFARKMSLQRDKIHDRRKVAQMIELTKNLPVVLLAVSSHTFIISSLFEGAVLEERRHSGMQQKEASPIVHDVTDVNDVKYC